MNTNTNTSANTNTNNGKHSVWDKLSTAGLSQPAVLLAKKEPYRRYGAKVLYHGLLGYVSAELQRCDETKYQERNNGGKAKGGKVI